MPRHHEEIALPDDEPSSTTDDPSQVEMTNLQIATDDSADSLEHNYHVLRDDRIIETIQVLEQRICDRFPESGLAKLCHQLSLVANQAAQRSEWISRPTRSIRWTGYALAIALIGLIAVMTAQTLSVFGVDTDDLEFTDLIQTLDAGISAVIFLAATIYFLINVEARIKRNRALKAIHELRSLAHIVDMHQLTKDPERVLPTWQGTQNSPRSSMTPLELNRYLDYCTEMLSLVGKIAALYITKFDDPVAVAAASEVEALCTGLSRKIWQKITTVSSVSVRSRNETR